MQNTENKKDKKQLELGFEHSHQQNKDVEQRDASINSESNVNILSFNPRKEIHKKILSRTME